MNEDDLKTVIELLKQGYMEADWKLVLESVEILQRDEEDEYQDEEQDNEFDDTDF